MLLARPPHQHHRHAGPRRLHHRGRAQPARPRRRGRRVRLGRRRRAPERDRLAPGRPLRRAPDRLRQQDGPDRRGLLRGRPDDGRPARRQRRADPAADRPGGRVQRDHRPDRDERDRLQGRPRHRVRDHRDPRRARRRGRGRPRDPRSQAVADHDDELAEIYLDGGEIERDRLVSAIRAAVLAIAITPVLCGSSFKNKGVQPLLDAVIDLLPSPLDVLPAVGHVPGTRRRGHPRRRSVRAVRRPRLQGDERPVRRPPHLPARLLGLDRHRLQHHQRHQGPQGAPRPAADDAREPPRGRGRRLGRRHRRRGRPQVHHHRRHADRRRRPGDPGADDLPRAGHRDRDRAEDQAGPGEAGDRARSACPTRTRPSASTRTRRPARP